MADIFSDRVQRIVDDLDKSVKQLSDSLSDISLSVVVDNAGNMHIENAWFDEGRSCALNVDQMYSLVQGLTSCTGKDAKRDRSAKNARQCKVVKLESLISANVLDKVRDAINAPEDEPTNSFGQHA